MKEIEWDVYIYIYICIYIICIHIYISYIYISYMYVCICIDMYIIHEQLNITFTGLSIENWNNSRNISLSCHRFSPVSSNQGLRADEFTCPHWGKAYRIYLWQKLRGLRRGAFRSPF